MKEEENLLGLAIDAISYNAMDLKSKGGKKWY